MFSPVFKSMTKSKQRIIAQVFIAEISFICKRKTVILTTNYDTNFIILDWFRRKVFGRFLCRISSSIRCTLLVSSCNSANLTLGCFSFWSKMRWSLRLHRSPTTLSSHLTHIFSPEAMVQATEKPNSFGCLELQTTRALAQSPLKTSSFTGSHSMMHSPKISSFFVKT